MPCFLFIIFYTPTNPKVRNYYLIFYYNGSAAAFDKAFVDPGGGKPCLLRRFKNRTVLKARKEDGARTTGTGHSNTTLLLVSTKTADCHKQTLQKGIAGISVLPQFPCKTPHWLISKICVS
jgi:hypothetical protein